MDESFEYPIFVPQIKNPNLIILNNLFKTVQEVLTLVGKEFHAVTQRTKTDLFI